MKILSWNVQGFAAKDTRDYLSDIIKSHNPDMVFLNETKISEEKAIVLIQRYNYPNSLIISSVGMYGNKAIVH